MYMVMDTDSIEIKKDGVQYLVLVNGALAGDAFYSKKDRKWVGHIYRTGEFKSFYSQWLACDWVVEFHK